MQYEPCEMDAGDGYESDGGSDIGEEVAHQFSPIFGREAPCFTDTVDEAVPYQVQIVLKPPFSLPPAIQSPSPATVCRTTVGQA